MPVFAYKALDAREAGERSGTIAADTPRQARDLLRERGLVVRGLSPAEAPVAGLKWRRGKGGSGRGRAPGAALFPGESHLFRPGGPPLGAVGALGGRRKGTRCPDIL